MLNTSLALRYARALFKISSNAGNTKKVASELKEITELIDTVGGLKRVLYHPSITSAEKKLILGKLFDSNCEALTVRFLGYLIDKKRIFQCTAIAQCFLALLDTAENRTNVIVESCLQLSGNTINKIKDRLGQSLGKKIVLTTAIVPELLGGIRILLGDRVIDGSIAFNLKRMTETITAF
jgi:F-type H+-transporting ATPase subunit delta